MKRILIIVSALLIALLAFPSSKEAYNFNGKKFSNPKQIKYFLHQSISNFGEYSNVVSGTLKINSAPQTRIVAQASSMIDAQIRIDYADFYNGSLYGSHSNGDIILYKKWRVELNGIQKRETVLHEVGHAFGLAHTQTKNDSIAVMRQYNFNNKDYLLTDDLKGLAARYP